MTPNITLRLEAIRRDYNIVVDTDNYVMIVRCKHCTNTWKINFEDGLKAATITHLIDHATSHKLAKGS